MKKVLTAILALAMALCVVSCGTANENNDGETSAQTTSAKAFAEWDDTDIINYFKSAGVFTDDSLLYVQEGEEAPIGVTKIVSYMDDLGDDYVIIMYFEPNSSIARTEEIYNEIKTTKKYIMTEAGNMEFPFNSMAGRFAVFYSMSLDDAFVADFEKAYDDLLATYNITPDFYDKEVEIPTDSEE